MRIVRLPATLGRSMSAGQIPGAKSRGFGRPVTLTRPNPKTRFRRVPGGAPPRRAWRASSPEQLAGIRMAAQKGGSGTERGVSPSDAELAGRLDRLSRNLEA